MGGSRAPPQIPPQGVVFGATATNPYSSCGRKIMLEEYIYVRPCGADNYIFPALFSVHVDGKYNLRATQNTLLLAYFWGCAMGQPLRHVSALVREGARVSPQRKKHRRKKSIGRLISPKKKSFLWVFKRTTFNRPVWIITKPANLPKPEVWSGRWVTSVVNKILYYFASIKIPQCLANFLELGS